MGKPDPEVVVAVVALFISLVALSANTLQILQQIYASAAGYAKCSEKVMGAWSKTKTRRFSWEELRFEVEFDAPVIFVCPPSNKKGPVPGAEIYVLEGTETSLTDTWTDSNMDTRKEYEGRSAKERIHTADNERASWSMLLSAIHRMESESREWQQKEYDGVGPPSGHPESHEIAAVPPELRTHHTLAVALQRKRKSWDTMPPTILRPYATTAMCHLIEMMAVLGVYWKEFDRKHDRYRAEGNGFMVLGERISDLGLMFSFQVIGKCTFKQKRVIPVDEIKELCFGYVPTIYRETLDQRRLEFPNDEPYNLSSLQMASRSEIAESLVLIGCNNNTVHYFLDSAKRTSHLFPISFEILGMLSRTYHIENSMFTYIPNPTPDRWDKRSVSLLKILEAYKGLLWIALSEEEKSTPIVNRIRRHNTSILKYQEKGSLERLCSLKALHQALDDCDEVLTAKSKDSRANAGDTPGRPSIQPRDKSADRLPKESPETDRQGSRRQKVQDVLRSHIQAILEFLNAREEHTTDGQSLQTSRAPSPTTPRFATVPRPPPPQLEDLDAASPDDKQHTFMEVYFDVIRVKVIERANRSRNRRESVHVQATVPILGAPPGFGFRRSGTARTHASSIREREMETASIPSIPTLPQENGREQEISPTKDEVAPLPEVALASLDDGDVSHNDIWCTLVFRMICWLMLHDFDKLDVQVSKSELLGSRMPVYIA